MLGTTSSSTLVLPHTAGRGYTGGVGTLKRKTEQNRENHQPLTRERGLVLGLSRSEQLQHTGSATSSLSVRQGLALPLLASLKKLNH